MRQQDCQKGFTLMEALLAAAILTVVSIAVSTAIVSGQSRMYDAIRAQRAMSLAEELVESIVAMPYVDPDGESSPGPEPGESGVDAFDNADDFHNYYEAPGEVTDAAGNAYGEDYQLFTRTVSAQYESRDVPGVAAAILGLNVTVTVTDDQGQSWTLTRFIPE